MDLVEILRRPEGKKLEYKRDLSSPDGVMKTLVAFANTAGGVLVIGVEDGTRKVVGVRDALAEEQRLANLVSTLIEPRLAPGIDIVPWRKTHVLAVEVFPSPQRPHSVARLGAEKGTFVRVGSTNRLASAAQIEEMRRYGGIEAFDERPMPDLNSEAIDFRVASELFAPVRKLDRAALRTLNLTARHQNREVPTVGGYLLFSRDRFERFPDSWIQAGCFAGRDRARLIDSIEIRDSLLKMPEAAIAFLKKHMKKEAVIRQVHRSDRWTVPLVALREAIVNAIVHADYRERGAPLRVAMFEDRIEIENPGLLPLGLTIDDLQHGISRLRNRVIGRVFHELGLIEQWGSGIQRMNSACREAGLPNPILEELAHRFRITFLIDEKRPPSLTSRERKILELLADGKGWSTSRLAGRLRLSARATRTALLDMIQKGLIIEVGTSPQDPKRRYYPARLDD
jgi:predicted HTH transcriptional regulator